MVPAEKLMKRAHEMAEGFLASSPTSLSHTKKLLLHYDESDVQREIETAIKANAQIRGTEDFSEGIDVVSGKTHAEMDRAVSGAAARLEKHRRSATGVPLLCYTFPLMTDILRNRNKSACVTRKPIRWAWFTTEIISPGSRWGGWISAGTWDLSTSKWNCEDDSFIVVADAHCRFKRPARFDEVLLIRTRVLASQTAHGKIRLRSGARRETKDLLATGETMHVFCDKLGRPKSLPEKYRKYFPAVTALGLRRTRPHQIMNDDSNRRRAFEFRGVLPDRA